MSNKKIKEQNKYDHERINAVERFPLNEVEAWDRYEEDTG